MVNGKVRGAHHESPIQRFRIKAGLSQEKAAEALGCGTRSPQRYESGRTDPPIYILQRMTSLYNCGLLELCPESTKDKIHSRE